MICSICAATNDFNPLPSCEGRRGGNQHDLRAQHFNPLPSCEGRRHDRYGGGGTMNISIHSPHTRGDTTGATLRPRDAHFNPLPSYEGRPTARPAARKALRHFNPLPSYEGRLISESFIFSPQKFQSTPLMRGETRHNFVANMHCIISIHSPHARGDADGYSEKPSETISIHSPHARGDAVCAGK